MLLATAALAACGNGQSPYDQGAGERREIGVLTIAPRALATRLDAREPIQLIDVRTPEEFAEGHLAGAINIPLDRFDPETLPDAEGAQIVLYCRSGRRSGIAAEKLAQASSSTALHLDGGIIAWAAEGLSVEH